MRLVGLLLIGAAVAGCGGAVTDPVVTAATGPATIPSPPIAANPVFTPVGVSAGPLRCTRGSLCGDHCIDTQTDSDNCGACGNVCATGSVCADGACALTCATGHAICSDPTLAAGAFCAAVDTDPTNCGACGVRCGAGEACSGGACMCPDPNASICGVGASSFCANTQTDAANCGACGIQCGSGAACTDGACACTDPNASICGGGVGAICVDLQTDVNHCGGCDIACGPNFRCESGSCLDNTVLVSRQYSETITASQHRYTINMKGTIDGASTRDPIGYAPWTQAFEPNLYVRMKNTGSVPVANPWISVGGRASLRTADETIAAVVTPDMSDKERVRAIFDQHLGMHFHANTVDQEDISPVKGYNIYGYAECGDSAHVLASLWSLSGLPQVRFGNLQGHVVPEVWFDSRWNTLDGDTQGVYLLRDNQTLASVDDLTRDHDLVKRTHNYGVTHKAARSLDEISASPYYGPAYYTSFGMFNTGTDITDTMNMTLRPGEALQWTWGVGAKYHGLQSLVAEVGQAAANLIANGQWSYDINFLDPSWYYAARDLYKVTVDQTGLHVQSGSSAGSFVVAMKSPYVFVGGKVSAPGAINLAFSWDKINWVAVKMATDGSTNLDSFFPPAGPARYSYYLRIDVGTKPVTAASIKNDVQIAPLGMPGLQLGDNVLAYRDETSAAHTIQIDHAWSESFANQPPRAVTVAVAPADGAPTLGSKLVFQWEPSSDPDHDVIADYEFLLSDRADTRWPLSSNFHALISATADAGMAQYTVPYAGLLNSNTTYYWKVRARDARAAWGPWSATFSFTTATPHPPQNVRLVVDSTARSATLAWDPAATGTAPVAYKVYGSDELGFSVSDSAYSVVWGHDDPTTVSNLFLSNLIGSVQATTLPVIGADDSLPNHVYYRVVAVDVNGNESGPSDFAEAARPLIFTEPPASAIVGQPYEYDARTLASLGDLRAPTTGVEGVAHFYDVEQPVYSLSNAPGWLAIDASTGIITGTPPSLGTFQAQVNVQLGAATDAQPFTIVVGNPPN